MLPDPKNWTMGDLAPSTEADSEEDHAESQWIEHLGLLVPITSAHK
jgi:hypothetical protein